MAHLEKYTRTQLGHILKHDERGRGEDGNYIKFGNKEINTELTHLNYNLVQRKHNLSNYEYIKRRAEKYMAKNVRKRGDINWVGSWVVTLPESLKNADLGSQRIFFEETTRFLAERYGKPNIISAYVHNDETTPHIHVKITPVIFDEKKNKYRYSAKEMFNRADLQTFHPDLSKYLEKVFGRDIGIYLDKKEGERLPNKTIKELKAENKRLDEFGDRLLKKAEKTKEFADRMEKRKELLEKEVAELNFVDKVKSRFVEKKVDDILEKAEELAREKTKELENRAITAEEMTIRAQRKEKAVVEENKKLIEARERDKIMIRQLESDKEILEKRVSRLAGIVLTFQKAFDRAERFLKGISKWIDFKRGFRASDIEEYGKFQTYRHDETLGGGKSHRRQEKARSGLDRGLDGDMWR